MIQKRVLRSALLLALCVGTVGCTEKAKQPETDEKPPMDAPADNRKDMLAVKPAALPVDELYPAEYVEGLVKEAEQMVSHLNEDSFPTELSNVQGRMRQDLVTSREKVAAGALSQAAATATNAMTYAFGIQQYLNFEASAEMTKQRTERMLQDLEADLKRQREQVERLDAETSDYEAYALLSVLEKQLGNELLAGTRSSWQQALKDQDKHLLFTTLMNLGNLQYQRDRVDLLLERMPEEKSSNGRLREEIAAWLKREIPLLQADAEKKMNSYEVDAHLGYRAAGDALSQARAVEAELAAGHTAYALELFLTAWIDLESAEQLEWVGTQSTNQPEIPLAKLKELRSAVVQMFDETLELVEQSGGTGIGKAWYLSKLHDANAQFGYADQTLEKKYLAEAVPDKVDAGQAYQAYVKAQAICQLVQEHIRVGASLKAGNLESKHR